MLNYEDTLKKNSKVTNISLRVAGNIEKSTGGYNMIYMYFVALLNFRSHFLATRSIYLAIPDHIDTIVFDSFPFLVANLVTIKYINFVRYRHEFTELKKIMAEKFWAANADSPPEEQEVILRYSRYVHIATLFHALNCSITGTIWALKPILEMYFLRGPDEPFQRNFPLVPWWPFHVDSYSNPMYPFEYLLQLFQMAATMAGTISMFCLYVYMVLHTCAQLKLVQMRVKNFSKTNNGVRASIIEQEKKLRRCIQVHQELLDFCSRMNDAFTIALFFDCCSGTLFICISGFGFKMFPGNLYVYSFCGLCLLSAIYLTFVLCFLANLLTTESLNVAFSAYDSDWYKAPVYLQKEIMFVIARSQNAAYFTAGGFSNLSLETFQSIMSTAVSYFTVLNSVNSDD